MKVLISGASGLIGKALIKSLTKDKHEVSRLVRTKESGANDIEWHPNQGQLDANQLEGFDVVVHLAGESIASGSWTDEKKRTILESRVKGTLLLSSALTQLAKPPAVFISASAIGYYGDRGTELLTEDSAAGQDFLADVCRQWEQSTKLAEEKGIRTIKARFGVILDKEGGALGKMLTPFRLGIGGRIGDGAQWMSWIALEDVIKGLRFVIDNTSINGPVNFVAPNPVTNAEFTRSLGHVLSRPTIFPVPAFAARLAFGEMADALLLSSTRVKPERLSNTAFNFKFTSLEAALREILK
jgi:uncharacterized protein (TIGR01777 family)